MKRRDQNVWMKMGMGAVIVALGCSPDDNRPTEPGLSEPVPGIGFPGLNATALDMISYDDALIAVGSFTQAQGQPARGAAQWNGTSWSPMGAGLGAPTTGTLRGEALAKINGRLFVGGEFNGAGESDALNLAEWNGTEWSRIDDDLGANGPVNAALPLMNGVFFGGEFNAIGSTGGSNVAWYDGVGGPGSWMPLGAVGSEGVNGPVLALAEYNGNLAVGGDFTRASGITVGNVAMWDGTTFSPLGQGFDGPVVALAEYNGDLYASGTFANAVGPWETETVSAAGEDGGTNVSMAIGGNIAYIAYFDPSTASIKVVEEAADGTYEQSTIETGGVGPDLSLAAKPNGDLWLAYFDSVNADARFGYRAAGTGVWQTGVIFAEGTAGRNCDITLDRLGRPWVAFDVEDSLNIVMVAEPGVDFDSPWRVYEPEPPSVEYRNSDAAIVIDSADRVHVAYMDMLGGNPRYACRGCVTPGVWISEAFHTSSSPTGFAMDITLDGEERPTVAYHDPNNGRVWSGGRDPKQGWQSRSSAGRTSADIKSLVVLTNPRTGTPVVVFGDDDEPDAQLVIATRLSQGWDPIVIARGPDDGFADYVSAAIRRNDYVVSFRNASDTSLRLTERIEGTVARRMAKWDGTSWESLGGLNWWASDLEVFNGRLYAVGAFSEVNGISASGLANWDGTSWSSAGVNTDAFTWSLYPYNGRLVVGGGFTQFDGRPANYIALAP